MEGMGAGLDGMTVEGFHGLARLVLVKDERHIDRFDRAFSDTFSGLEQVDVGDLLDPAPCPRGGWRSWPKSCCRTTKRRRSRAWAACRR